MNVPLTPIIVIITPHAITPSGHSIVLVTLGLHEMELTVTVL